MRRFWDARAREDAFHFISTGLDRGAPDLDRFWATGPRDLAWILSRLGVEIDPVDEVVEIGCGVGRMTRPLAGRAAAVRALDVSSEMIARAREHNRGLDNVQWIVGDGGSLAGIDDASADACLSFVVFQHVPREEIVLAYVDEMGRVLRPGGWAAFQISNEPPARARHPAVAGARGRIAALRSRLPGGWAHDPAWRGCTVDLARMRATAAAAGMQTERVEGAGTQYCFVLVRRAVGVLGGGPLAS